MRVIPVLDIKGGLVVHAQGGNRASYRPIVTPLARSADPADVARGLLGLFPFDTLYIADLDGIAGTGRNHDSICALRAEVPAIELWIDDGSTTAAAIAALARMPRVRPVVGSETLASIDLLVPLLAAGEGRAILSLDSKGDAFFGPQELLSRTDLWPDTVIAMTLAAVGAGGGPDLVRVSALAQRAPAACIVAAGGVRNLADLEALATAGAGAALVATALHSKTIEAGDLQRVAGLEVFSSRS